MIGKEIRLERIINRDSGKTVIVPMDHGVSVGPILGITNMRDAMSQAAVGGANAVVVHKGVVARGHRKSGPDMGPDSASVRKYCAVARAQRQDSCLHRGRGHQAWG